MRYIIGVDGGGTKTESIAYDLEGKEIGRGLAGFGNLAVSEEEALNNIVESVGEAMEYLRKEDCLYIVLGVAGSEVGDNAKKIEKRLENEFNCKVMCLNDADIGVAALFEGGDGVMTIGGTGSISIGIKGGVKASAGGFGHLLGDEGSGYHAAKTAIKKMTEDDDDDKKLSPLSKAILEHLNLKTVSDMIGFVYSNGKAEIASITPVIVDVAKKGDATAIEILRNEGISAAKTTIKCINKLQITENIKVGIVGSFLIKADIVRRAFEDTLKDALGDVAVIESNGSPAKGGYYIAKKELQ